MTKNADIVREIINFNFFGDPAWASMEPVAAA